MTDSRPKRIAAECRIAQHTVRDHIKAIFDKAGVGVNLSPPSSVSAAGATPNIGRASTGPQKEARPSTLTHHLAKPDLIPAIGGLLLLPQTEGPAVVRASGSASTPEGSGPGSRPRPPGAEGESQRVLSTSGDQFA
jgi:hypothetical protein